MSDIKKIKPGSPGPTGQNTFPAGPIRERILKAAFSLFSESGFSDTSMLDIVTRARLSKRDLYALFPNKHAVLAACIHERADRMRRPLDTAATVPQTRGALAKLLIDYSHSFVEHWSSTKRSNGNRLTVRFILLYPDEPETFKESLRV
jgi:AcrR family transcriptional regulator